MRFLLFIAVLAVLLWTFLLRSIFVLKRYDNHGNEVILPEPIDAEALFQKLRTELQYPDIKATPQNTPKEKPCGKIPSGRA